MNVAPISVDMIDLPTKHWSQRQGQPLRFLVLHGADDPNNGTVHSTARYLRGPNSRGVSSHECVGYDRITGKGVVYRLLDADRASHCVGNSRMPDGSTGNRANQRSYNIEAQHHTGMPMHPHTRWLLIQQAAAFCLRHGWTPDEIRSPSNERAVLAHHEIDTRGKTCPGLGWQDMDAIRKEIAHIVYEARGEHSDPWDRDAEGPATWYVEQLARARRGDAGATESLIAALNEPPNEDQYMIIVSVALPPLVAWRSRE